MKKLYNKIKPVGRRAIVLVDVDGKKSHTIDIGNGKTADLYLATEYSWDSRVTSFTQGVLLTDFKNFKAGIHVLLHHSSLGDECEMAYNGIPEGHKLFSVETNFIYFGIDNGKIIPLDGYMLAERMYEPEPISPAGIILISEPVKIDNKLKILAKPDSITDFEVGDIAITYKYSDYEMNHNLNGKQESLIRLKYSDCLAKETI
jgi:hypothetical protein